MVRRTRVEMEETRASLLATARKVFSERGYADTSMDDLTAQAGLTRGGAVSSLRRQEGLAAGGGGADRRGNGWPPASHLRQHRRPVGRLSPSLPCLSGDGPGTGHSAHRVARCQGGPGRRFTGLAAPLPRVDARAYPAADSSRHRGRRLPAGIGFADLRQPGGSGVLDRRRRRRQGAPGKRNCCIGIAAAGLVASKVIAEDGSFVRSGHAWRSG